MSLEQLVDDALRDPFAAARAHARDGGRVIGYVGSDIPVELLVAGGAFPFRLPSALQDDVAAADRYLEAGFAPEVRVIAQQYLEGRFDFLEAVVLSRGNDSAQRLYYYLCELRSRKIAGGPKPLIYDLAKIPRETSRAHSRAATARLGLEIGVDLGRLPRAIEERNRRRELFARVASHRRSTPQLSSPASSRGSMVDRLSRAADWCVAEVFDKALDEWLTPVLDKASDDRSAPVLDKASDDRSTSIFDKASDEALSTASPKSLHTRLVLAGSAPPDERLHLAVESAGGNIVAEWGDHAACGVEEPVIAPDGGYAAIADHYQARKAGPRAFVDGAASIAALAKAVRADGVIIWLIEQEDALIWDLPAQKAALVAAGVPVLVLARRRWDGSDAAAEISSFTQSVRGGA
jgi:hypothetical protein